MVDNMVKPKSDQRNSNFEILRIFAMLMITAYHYVVHGECTNNVTPSYGMEILLNIGSGGGKIGVNIFCLLMGYFGLKIGVSSHSFKKLLKLESQVLFYSLGGLIAGALWGLEVTKIDIIKSVMPTLFEQYWFMTAYFIVYLLSPYINICILNLNNREYLRFMLILYLIGSILPFFTLRPGSGLFWTQLNWFIIMYITGAYLRKMHPRYTLSKYITAFLVAAILMMVAITAVTFASHYYPTLSRGIGTIRWSNSPFSIVICVSLFRIAQLAHERHYVYINKIASLCIGAYLFQENIFFSQMLWGNYFKNSLICTTTSLLYHFISSVIIVFGIGIIIEFFRSFLSRYISSMAIKMQCKC